MHIFGDFQYIFWPKIKEYIVILVNLDKHLPLAIILAEKDIIYYNFFPKKEQKNIKAHSTQNFKKIKNA